MNVPFTWKVTGWFVVGCRPGSVLSEANGLMVKLLPHQP